MSIGLPNGDLMEWLRRCAIVLSRSTYTAVPFWLGLPLSELVEWIHTHNDLVDEADKNRK